MEATITNGQMPQHSPEFLRERKFLMIIPLLILPFLTMGFWALGGGKQNTSTSDKMAAKGLNATLPQAQFKNQKSQDKMDVYQTQKQDSANSGNGVSQSFIRSMGFDDSKAKRADSIAKTSAIKPPGASVTADANEAKIQAKLAQINRQIGKPEASDYEGGSGEGGPSGADVKRLQLMMKTMNSNGGSGNDPEMKQLTQILQQINDIQNPENANARSRNQSLKNHQRVYPVLAASEDDDDNNANSQVIKQYASYEGGKGKKQHAAGNAHVAGNTIQAVIHEDQSLVSGAVIKLRLEDGIYVNGRMIPKGSFVYGTCALTGERLEIKIASIRYLNNIFPVSLAVYDLDGMEGLYVPGSIGRDAAKNGVGDAVQSLQIMSMDQSVGTQAASAGVEAAKGLFNHKVKQIKVKVKAGYEVLLKDSNDKDN